MPIFTIAELRCGTVDSRTKDRPNEGGHAFLATRLVMARAIFPTKGACLNQSCQRIMLKAHTSMGIGPKKCASESSTATTSGGCHTRTAPHTHIGLKVILCIICRLKKYAHIHNF